METFEPKKLLILRILEILTEYSNSEHKLRQGEIISLLNELYAIDCERKAVARNIEFLQQAGYDIVSDGKGVYLATRKFEAGELRLLIDSVLANRNICAPHAKALIAKLAKEGGKYFKSYAKHVISLNDWQRDESQDFFFKIELLCEAIREKVKVEFYYNSYGADKELHHTKEEKSLVSPYALFLKNGRYYLVCNFDKHRDHAYCRVDKITDIALTFQPARYLTEVEGFENGLNLGRLNTRLPYLYEDEPQRIEFITANSAEKMIDNVFDWFGKDVQIEAVGEGEFKFSLTASPRAVRFWILQYGRYVKVLSPQSLVEQIKEDIREMQKLYEE